MSVVDGRLAESTLRAWSASFLFSQSAEVRDTVLRGSRVVRFAASEWICTAQGGPLLVALVHDGKIRAKVSSEDGREVTTRYFGPGQLTSLPALLIGEAPSSLEAVTHCEVTLIEPGPFHRLLRSNAELCFAVAGNLAQATFEAVSLLGDNLFGTVQQRVCRHLLEMARQVGDDWVVQTDQAALASAIGSVREVVARNLRLLEEAGAIRRSRRQIQLLDMQQLARHS